MWALTVPIERALCRLKKHQYDFAAAGIGTVLVGLQNTGTSTERWLLSSLWNIPVITGHVTYMIARITKGPPIARADIPTPYKSVCCFRIRS